MRFSWCLLWVAILVAIILTIPLIDRSAEGINTQTGTGTQESPLLPAPRQP